MAELLIAVAALSALAALALVAVFVPLELLIGASLSLMALGFVIGVPAGLYYHVLLRRELTRRGGAPKGWYWRPLAHQAGLEKPIRDRLMHWFAAGGAGFFLIMTGFGLTVTALLLALRAGGSVLP